jgi:transposase InsO family protein
LIIQTDNGTEFRNPANSKVTHIVDWLLEKLGIEHKCIQAYTPRHNGKIERSHRNDQQRFYNFNMFTSFEDLVAKMKAYLVRSNNIPSRALGWKSPNQKRAELLAKSELRVIPFASQERAYTMKAWEHIPERLRA